MGFLAKKIRGSLTVEASFVVGIILIIILYQTSYTLELFTKAKEYGEKCVTELQNTNDVFNSMRLTRLAFKWAGKE